MAARLARERRAYRSAVRLVAKETGFRITEIETPCGRAARRARQIAAYVASTVGDVPLRRLAPVVGVRLYAVQRGVAGVEDLRDDPVIDRLLCRLEERFAHAS